MTDFRREATKSQITPWFNSSTVVFRDQKDFNTLPAANRLQSAKEIVINIYLAAMADFVVCTYSSNICRLVALLRNGTLSDVNVSSLDWPHWTIVWYRCSLAQTSSLLQIIVLSASRWCFWLWIDEWFDSAASSEEFMLRILHIVIWIVSCANRVYLRYIYILLIPF